MKSPSTTTSVPRPGRIARNKSLDPIFDKHGPILADLLAMLNEVVSHEDAKTRSGEDSRKELVAKWIAKHRQEVARAVTDADQSRRLLSGTDPELIRPVKGAKGLAAIFTKQSEVCREAIPKKLRAFAPSCGTPIRKEWEVPFDTDPDWPQPAQDALAARRQAWRAKMDEVNACIEANAEQEKSVGRSEF